MLTDQHGADVDLAALFVTGPTLVAFYPFAFTRVCSSELPGFSTLADDGHQVVGVSCDPVASLRVFAGVEQVRVPLLSDFWPHGALTTAYGVFDERRGSPRRSSFVVDRRGRITWSLHVPSGEVRDLGEQRAALVAAG